MSDKQLLDLNKALNAEIRQARLEIDRLRAELAELKMALHKLSRGRTLDLSVEALAKTEGK